MAQVCTFLLFISNRKHIIFYLQLEACQGWNCIHKSNNSFTILKPPILVQTSGTIFRSLDQQEQPLSCSVAYKNSQDTHFIFLSKYDHYARSAETPYNFTIFNKYKHRILRATLLSDFWEVPHVKMQCRKAQNNSY